MPLINLTSNLKDNKFGHDRIDGGSSNQPYIKTPIPEKIGEFGYLNQDFILRGGSKALTNSALDVVRLGKYFTDIRNPSGLLFTIKQNLLSRMAVRTQSSTGLLNEGIYTPLSTLTEAGGVAFGLHVNKQGLNPFGGVGGISTYSDTIRLATNESFFDSHDRLAVLYGYKILNDESTLYFLNGIKVDSGRANILSYRGGPGSILGIGNTNIKFAGSSASERTGANNPLLKTNKEFFLGKEKKISLTQYLNKEGKYVNLPESANRFLGVSYFDELGFLLIDGIKILPSISVISPIVTNNITNLLNPNNNKTVTFTAGQISLISSNTLESVNFPGESRYISNINGPNPTTIPGDFRRNLRKNQETLQKDQETVGNLADAPNYITQNIELRTSLGNPGSRTGKKLTSYTSGSDGSGAASLLSYDIINASEIGDKNNDLVDFTIKAIDNNTPTSTTNIQFRAFLNQISDAYTAEWNDTRYIGRGEKFYNYGGFDRKVSLSWTVAAQSKVELIPMYKKLNYLASLCAPNYSTEGGYMRGNIVKLTVGGYFYDQPGIITGFSYEMNDDNATWEIGINDEGGVDNSVKQLPHLIKVNGFNFIPIHTFTPKKVESITNTQQRYIALENSLKGNSYSLPPKKPKLANPQNLQNQQSLYTGPDSSEIQPNNNLS